MWTTAVPMSEPSGQAAGLASKTLATQAFWIVVSRAGRVAGIVRIVLATCASPAVDLNFRLEAGAVGFAGVALGGGVDFGFEGQALTALDLEGGGDVGAGAFATGEGCFDLHRVAAGGVVLEPGTVDWTCTLFELQGDAFELEWAGVRW